MGAFAQHLAEGAAAALAGEQAEHVADDVLEMHAAGQLGLDVRTQVAQQRRARSQRPAPPCDVEAVQQVGVVVRRAPEHGAVGVRQVRRGLRLAGDAAVDHDLQARSLALEPVRPVVAERGYLAVLLRAQAFQPGIARVHDEQPATRLGDRIDELAETPEVVVVVDAQPALDRHRHLARRDHRRHRIGDQGGLAHQAGAEPSGLHPVGGASAIEVDLVEPARRTDACRFREQAGVAAAEL